MLEGRNGQHGREGKASARSAVAVRLLGQNLPARQSQFFDFYRTSLESAYSVGRGFWTVEKQERPVSGAFTWLLA